MPEILLRFAVEVAKLIEAERLTVWYSVATILIHLLERGALDRHDISGLRWVLFGGEVVPADALASLIAERGLGEAAIKGDTDLLLTGLVHSMCVLVIVAWLEDRVGIDPIDIVLDDFQTVDQMLAYVDGRS